MTALFDFSITEIEQVQDDDQGEYFKPGPSKVICHIIEGGSYYFRRRVNGHEIELDLEFNHIYHSSGDADIEADAGMLTDAIASMLDANPAKKQPDFWRPGWFVVEGFRSHYTTDYYGEVDAEYDYERTRLARWSDFAELVDRPPWWAKMLLNLGIDLTVPAKWMEPK